MANGRSGYLKFVCHFERINIDIKEDSSFYAEAEKLNRVGKISY